MYSVLGQKKRRVHEYIWLSLEVTNKMNFITNNTAKIQIKILGRTFRLTSGAIVNAKKFTLSWVLSHDAKERETETEPGEVLVLLALHSATSI